MPKRLLGTALKGMVPELLPPAERQRVEHFAKTYQGWKGERIDMLNLAALGLADTVEAILRQVADPSNAGSVKKFLESTPIPSFQTIRFSPQRHVGMDASDIAIVEYKNGAWAKADPIR